MSWTLPERLRQHRRGVQVLPEQLGLERLFVHREHDAARLGRLRWRATFVVEQRNGAISVSAHIVLEGEIGPRPRVEGRLFAPQPPEHLSARALDFVKSPGVAAGNYEVAVRLVDVYRIDVEIVPGTVGLRRLGTSSSRPDVVVTAPLENQLPRAQVDLLHDAVEITSPVWCRHSGTSPHEPGRST